MPGRRVASAAVLLLSCMCQPVGCVDLRTGDRHTLAAAAAAAAVFVQPGGLVVLVQALVTDDAAANALAKEASGMPDARYSDAVKKMAEARALASDSNAKVPFNAAVLAMKRGNFKDGQVHYLAAIAAAARAVGDKEAIKYAAMSHNNLCVELDKAGKYKQAHGHCTEAARKASWKFWMPHKTLGLITEKWSQTDIARDHYLTAHKYKRNDPLVLHAATMLPLVYDSLADMETRIANMNADVSALEKKSLRLDNMLALATVPHFYAAFWGTNNVELYQKIARVIIRSDPLRRKKYKERNVPAYVAYEAPFAMARIAKWKAGEPVSPRNSGKIKVGFSSMFFKTHASGKMIQAIIAGLDRERFEVVVFCIKERFSDPYMGVVADRIRNRADTYIELPKPRGIEAMREAVEAEELDILVYGEIGMDPANYALAFARLAPVQVMTHGHASTSGIPNVDYFVSYKPFEAPDAQKFYSERLVTFSDFSPYYKPDVPKNMPSRAKLFGDLKVAVGAKTTVFICLQTLFKLTPEFDPIFEAILKRVPDGLILMKAFRSKEVQERLMARLKATVPGVIDRVVMLPGLNAANWNGLLRHADVVLDSYPFGGYTTTLEVVASGSTPIVTLPHEQMAGRCTAGFLEIMGVTDTIARDKADYVEVAARLAEDAKFREGVENQMRTNAHLLYDRPTVVGEWEQFFEEINANTSVTNLHDHTPRWRRTRSKMRPKKRIPRGADVHNRVEL